jgi:hypothetical protein
MKLATLFQERVNWEDLFNPKEPFESTYLLYLTQAFIGDGSDRELAELRQEPTAEERKALRLSILTHNCIPWAINQIKDLKTYINYEATLVYIRALLNLIFIYIAGALHSNKKLPRDLVHLTYKIQEKAKANEVISKLYSNSLEHEVTEPLEDRYLVCYKELCELLCSDIGLSLLSTIDCLDFSIDILDIMNSLLSFTVASKFNT